MFLDGSAGHYPHSVKTFVGRIGTGRIGGRLYWVNGLALIETQIQNVKPGNKKNTQIAFIEAHIMYKIHYLQMKYKK